VLHNIYKTFANGAEVFSPDWSLLLEIWHESTAQLIADGVPQERIFPSGGVYHVLRIWKSNRTHLPAYKDLPRWAYDPAFDTHKATCSDGATSGGVEGLLAEFGMEDMMAHEQVALDDEDVDVSDNEDTPYSWPNDTNRYKVLASSAELTSTVIRKESPTPADSAVESTVDPAIRIMSKQPRATVMGQHRVSTLRILVRIMRDIHSDVFHGKAELGENDFWTHVWFRLDETWEIKSEKKLKTRFGWVLDYIRIGALPNEAQCVKDALREVWMDAGTILRTAQHPYGYYPGCANESYFNPDLCPRWAKAVMAQNNAMSNVLGRLHSLCGVQFSQETIANCYGVLVADLWEEAYAQGWLDDSQSCQTSSGETPEAHHGTEIYDGATAVDKDIVATATGTSVRSKTLRSRKRPADYENTAEETAQKKSRRESAEDNNSNPDQEIQDGLERLSKPRWTKEQKDWVVSTFPHGETDWDEMSRQFAIRFGVTRSRNAFKQECINNLNWKSFSDDWNFKQRLWLCKAAQQGTSWTQMVEPFNKEFKTHRTSEELETQFEAMRHYFNPATPESSKPRWARGSRNHRLQSTLFPLSRTSKKWTPEEEDWLCQRITGKADWKDIGAEIAVKFGTQRTIQALQTRLGMIRARARRRPIFEYDNGSDGLHSKTPGWYKKLPVRMRWQLTGQHGLSI
jgi:hypothetical protein